jgi:hypothetical protein
MAISSRINFLACNILEEGTVTVTAVDSGYPKERLFDRSLGFYCKYSSAVAYVVQIAQGTPVLAVDTLIIEGHALNGVQVDWQYSANGSSWTTALSWTQSGNIQIAKQLAAAVTANYWRVSMGSHVFQATEVFMGRALSVPVVWDSSPKLNEVPDVDWLRTYGGVDHSIRIGPKRKARAYQVFMDRVNFPIETFRSDLAFLDDYVKPFYIIDHEASCFLAKFDGTFQEDHMNEGLLMVDFSVLEIP